MLDDETDGADWEIQMWRSQELITVGDLAGGELMCS